MSTTAAIIIFALALLAGWEVTARVPARLHTPLMSAAAAVGGVIVVGGIAVAARGGACGATVGTVAVTAATAAAAGGLVLTARMGRMLKRRKEDRP